MWLFLNYLIIIQAIVEVFTIIIIIYFSLVIIATLLNFSWFMIRIPI